jgi:hypothetical protein
MDGRLAPRFWQLVQFSAGLMILAGIADFGSSSTGASNIDLCSVLPVVARRVDGLLDVFHRQARKGVKNQGWSEFGGRIGSPTVHPASTDFP